MDETRKTYFPRFCKFCPLKCLFIWDDKGRRIYGCYDFHSKESQSVLIEKLSHMFQCQLNDLFIYDEEKGKIKNINLYSRLDDDWKNRIKAHCNSKVLKNWDMFTFKMTNKEFEEMLAANEGVCVYYVEMMMRKWNSELKRKKTNENGIRKHGD